MGILDEAIKEHLELKRQHGAGESELQQLEDEAFGAAERPGAAGSAPDPLAEAPTELMSQPEPGEGQESGATATEGEEEVSAAGDEEASARRRTEIADLQEAPPPASEPPAEPGPEEPAREEAPAMEHEAIPEPKPEAEVDAEPEPEAGAEPESSAGPSTEERHAIAEQPTEMYDVEEELGGSGSQAPSEEELVEEEIMEPRLAPIDPLSGVHQADDEAPEAEPAEAGAGDAELDDEFWDEKRLSDELDQALEAPREAEAEAEVVETLPEEEGEGSAEPAAEEEEWEESVESRDEDVLEETPDFLEEAPEDDQLWFEQKPPKDFDFDD